MHDNWSIFLCTEFAGNSNSMVTEFGVLLQTPHPTEYDSFYTLAITCVAVACVQLWSSSSPFAEGNKVNVLLCVSFT